MIFQFSDFHHSGFVLVIEPIKEVIKTAHLTIYPLQNKASYLVLLFGAGSEAGI